MFCRVIYLSLLSGLLLLHAVPASAQKVLDKSPDRQSRTVYSRIKGLEAGAGMGYVATTENFLKWDNRAGRPINQLIIGHLKFMTQARGGSDEDIIFGSPYVGGGAFISSYRHRNDIGRPWGLYFMQGARIARLTPRLSLDYEWNFGLSGGWRKYDPVTNPQNNVIGTKLNAYLNVNFYLSWIVNRYLSLNVGMAATHYSNGNTTVPNAGINAIGGYIGVRTYFNRDYDTYRKYPKGYLEKFRRKMFYELMVYASWKDIMINTEGTSIASPYLNRKFFVGGFSFSPMYALGHKIRVGGSLDFGYDESAGMVFNVMGDYVESKSAPVSKQLSFGLAAKADFVMPFVTLSGSVGVNLANANKRAQSVYQILAVKLSMSRNVFLNVGYKTTGFHYPDCIMLGVGCRLSRHDDRR